MEYDVADHNTRSRTPPFDDPALPELTSALARSFGTLIDHIVERAVELAAAKIAEARPASAQITPTPEIPQPRAWMTSAEVAEQSGRHPGSVLHALRRGLLKGSQRCAGGSWRVSTKAFEDWMNRGAPIDDPVKARLRRMA